MTFAHQTAARSIAARAFLITFSGIDGAGKTTQIEYLASHLRKRGLRVLRLGFWDHIAVWPGLRAGVGHRALDLCHTKRTDESAFAPKNHKLIRKWYLTGARLALYLLDVVRLRHLLARRFAGDVDVIIFDRYIYDQMANIYSRSFAARFYRRILVKVTPAPDLAFILDASPAVAFQRKPEYPVEFMHQNRRNFLSLQEVVPQLITISEAELEDVRSEIRLHVYRSPLVKKIAAHEGQTESSTEGTVVGR
jgi:thymidylate kinase